MHTKCDFNVESKDQNSNFDEKENIHNNLLY